MAEVVTGVAIAGGAQQSLSFIPTPLAGNGKGKSKENSSNLPSQFAYSFEVLAYDKKHQFIVDPALYYSIYIGGTIDDSGYGIAVDGARSFYVTGYPQNVGVDL